jgi:SAM-dependent methyltransferase
MAFNLGGQLSFWLLRAMCRHPQSVPRRDDLPPEPHGAARIERFLGPDVWQMFAGRRVLDFGCGHGAEAIAAARHGAEHVWGIDIQEHRLAAARHSAAEEGVADRCTFLHALTQEGEIAELGGTVDCAYSIDSFEHCDRADLVLDRLFELLVPGGQLLISFGPPWKNPYGGHTRYFCRWPWIHLLFAEETILAVRALYRDDGARRFEEVEGGLSRLTVSRFLRLIEDSPFHRDLFRAIPVSTRFLDSRRPWHCLLTNRLLREYFTSVVLCRLTRPMASAWHGLAAASAEPSTLAAR